MRIYMQTVAEQDKAPRYYQLNIQQDLIEGWTLVREWGKLGAGGRVKHDHFESLENALEACIKVRDVQLERGYQLMFTQGQELSA
ncbi:MAG: WGR domain-containing protein, partial [Gammaproteobacteria bacterium]|nr:WGR domain-containing protein [Gammaproteobacteria bacterium]MDH5778694.1 WGR domain-containing protein [Gammaproteobacteria bacterium]